MRGAGIGGVALASGSLLGACGGKTSTTSSAGKPRRGGQLHLGVLGGSSSDSLDGDNPIGFADFSRVAQLYDPLVEYGTDGAPRLVLAEEITHNGDASQWTIRIRSDVTFHDGKPLTIHDVIHTLRRIANPKKPLEGAVGIVGARGVDFKAIKIQDQRTARIPMRAPNVALTEVLAQPWFYIVPEGYDPHRPVGTGAFQYVSFTPGSQSVFKRNPNYWQDPLPYVDQVTITNFSESSAQVNALISGSVDLIDQVPRTGVLSQLTSSGTALVTSHTQGFQPLTMRVDTAPFNDVRVRQAMRLLVDRKQMVEVVLGGHGTVGNDIFSKFDPDYDSALPQRAADPEAAKSLLRAAGHSDLRVQLVTADIAAGVVDAAQVFAQQATAGGVKVAVDHVTVSDFFGKSYLSYPFAQDWWSGFPYLVQVGQAMLPKSPFNETHWQDARYVSLYNQAIAEVNTHRRRDLIHAMQTIEYKQGGYIVPYFVDIIDAHAQGVGGVVASRAGLPFNGYDLKRVWKG